MNISPTARTAPAGARATPALIARRPGPPTPAGDTLQTLPPHIRRAAEATLSGLRFLESQPARDLADRRLRNRFDALRRAHATTAAVDWHVLLRDVEDAVAYGGLRNRRPAPAPRRSPGTSTAA